jgi:histidine kinase/DNA gyrase B/HSP90-like ATPase
VRTRGLLRRGERLRERLDINDVIREVIALSHSELRRNGVSLRTDLPGILPQVVVERILLQQVILNLIMNAIEAVRAVKDRARVLRIRTKEQSSGRVVVLVQDSGVGVDPEHSSRIFEAWGPPNLPSKSSARESCKRCGPGRWQRWCEWQKSWAYLRQRTSRFTPTCNCRFWEQQSNLHCEFSLLCHQEEAHHGQKLS